MNQPEIPSNWTAEQAKAALDLLDACYDAIWNAYEKPVTELLIRDEQLAANGELRHQADCDEDFDDDIPF